MSKSIKLVKPHLHDFDLFISRVKEAFKNGYITNNGPFLQKFEEEVTQYLGIPVVAVANGTLGIELVLRGLNLKGKVIVPSFTYCATAHAICRSGLEPTFVDIDQETFTLDPKEVEDAITPDTCAIMGVHVFGVPCAIDDLEEIARRHNLVLLFDAAHAFGSIYKGRRVGQFGMAEIFSTHATKVLSSGEGGIIATNNKDLFAYLQQARVFGMSHPEDTNFIGTNAKMSEIHAIMGLDNIHKFRQSLIKRNTVAQSYHTNLKGTSGLRFQKIPREAESNNFFFSVVVNEKEFGMNRDRLAELLDKNGVQSRKYYYLPLHQQQAYKKYAGADLPNTEAIASNILCLPTHTDITESDVNYICEVIRSAATPSLSPISPTSFLIQSSHDSQIFNSSSLLKSSQKDLVLVTGGAGYVGCVLVKKLLEAGYAVRILDQLIFGKEPLLEFIDNPYFDLQIGTVEDKYMVQKCLQDVKFIIHLAGLSNDPSCEINADLTRKANIDATKVLVDVAKKKRVRRFIYASSCSVYGFTGADEVNEDSPVNPLTAYAKSKVDSEAIIRSAATAGFVTICLRKATIYGPSPRMRFDLVVNTMAGMGIAERKITINGGEQWRPFVHINDVADAYLFMLEAHPDDVNGKVFNVGSNEQNVMISGLAHQIAAMLPAVRVEQSPAPDNRSYQVSFNRINSLGWKARHTIEDGVLGIKKMFDEGKIRDFRDLNYFNIKRMITYLNV